MANKLARDDTQAVLQVASYKTSDAENLDSGTTAPYEYNTIVRLVATAGAVWVVVGEGVTPADQTGLYIPDQGELHILVYKNSVIGTTGSINITPLGN
jgi:hypothetical protein